MCNYKNFLVSRHRTATPGFDGEARVSTGDPSFFLDYRLDGNWI